METCIFETKNYAIGILGEYECAETGNVCERYIVEVKGIDCLFIMFEFVGDELICRCAWDQDNMTQDGQALTDFTHRIANLIENDVIDIVKFMKKHLEYPVL